MTEHAFWKLAEEDPSRVAVIDAEGKETSAGELLRASNQIVHGLRALGLRPGDAIAVMLTNEVPMLELYMAAVQAGWYMTPINSHLTAPEVAYIVADCEAKALFCNPRTADACVQAAKSLNFPAQASFATGVVSGFRPFAELKARR
jgi:long-chain acyl-CoA synthetase